MKRVALLLVLSALCAGGCSSLNTTLGGGDRCVYVAVGAPVSEAAELGARVYYADASAGDGPGVAAYGRLDVGPAVEVPLTLFGSDASVAAQPFIDGEIGYDCRERDFFDGVGGGVAFDPFRVRYVYGGFPGSPDGDEEVVFLEMVWHFGGATR